MIRRYITLIYCSATLSGLFALPTAVVAQEQTMTREERIKALERLKMEDARWETVKDACNPSASSSFCSER